MRHCDFLLLFVHAAARITACAMSGHSVDGYRDRRVSLRRQAAPGAARNLEFEGADFVKMRSQSRKQSIVEVAERTFDKNTLILIVNVIILAILMSMLYIIATSAYANAAAKDEH
uniref:Triple QxxK/R motif-containing protein n=1 Tax=Steinernema glaseri TaxID=37863 RepID=A0A1I8AAA6_9BILA